MKYKLPEKLVKIKEYVPLEDKYSIKMDANESFIMLSKEIEEKVMAELSKISLNRYPDPLASELCGAYARYINIDKDKVVAGNGSDELISVIENAFLKKGDTIVITKPDFTMYAFYANLNEINFTFFEKGEDLKINVDSFIEFINNSGASMVIFSNPCNPTGQYLEVREMEKILKSINALVVLDEAYMEFCGKSAIGLVDSYENLIILKTASKAIGLAALRLGFAISNPKTAGLLRKAKSPFNVNTVSQKAGAVILSELGFINNSISDIIKSKDYLNRKLEEIVQNCVDIEVFSTATNFSLIKTKRAKELYSALLERGIAVRLLDGEYLRITASKVEDNEIFLKTFCEILGGVK